MKKTSLILALLMFLTAVVPAYAQTLPQTAKTGNLAASKSALRVQTEANRLGDLKQRATAEITRRAIFLNEFSKKIDDLKKLSTVQKDDLKAQIQAQITSLNTFQIKIDSDADLTTLKTDVKPIVNGYNIFAFFRVKISLLVASNRLGVTTDMLNTVYTKLQTRISEQEAKGMNVVALNTLLIDMLAKIDSVKKQYEAAQLELTTLTAEGYPVNKSTLLDARTKLKQGEKDLRAAYQDAVKIRQGLGDIKGNLRKGTFETNTNKNSTPSGNE